MTLGLRGPGGHRLLKSVLGHTETDKVVVLNVLSDLGVNLSSLEIIIGVLKFKHDKRLPIQFTCSS